MCGVCVQSCAELVGVPRVAHRAGTGGGVPYRGTARRVVRALGARFFRIYASRLFVFEPRRPA